MYFGCLGVCIHKRNFSYKISEPFLLHGLSIYTFKKAMFQIEIGDLAARRPETLLLIKFKKLVQELNARPLLFFRRFRR